MPPWMSLVLRLEVPLAKSLPSTRSVRYPREAESMAQPSPVAPPPMMSMSQVRLPSAARPTIASLSITMMLRDELEGLALRLSAAHEQRLTVPAWTWCLHV